MARWKWLVLVVSLIATAAWAGAPPPTPAPTVAGPTRGGMDIVLPYYPPTVRAAGMGIATVALEGVDSHNPAALAFVEGYDVTIDFGRAAFRHGPDLNIYHGHLVFPVPLVGGVSQLMCFGISTENEDFSKMGGYTHVWAHEMGLAYGRKVPLPEAIPGELGVGFAGFPYDPSEVRVVSTSGARAAWGRGHSKVGSIRLGFLYKPVPELSLAGQYTHIKDTLRAEFLVPGLGIVPNKSIYHVNVGTVGAAYRPDERTVIVAQFLFGRARGEGVHTQYDIFSAGVERELTVTDDLQLALRAGIHDGHPTCGVGVKLPQGWRVDYAFLAGYGEELRRAFGRGPLHMVGVGKRF